MLSYEKCQKNDRTNDTQTYSDVCWIVCNRFGVVLTHVASQILVLFILKKYLNLSETYRDYIWENFDEISQCIFSESLS